MSADERGAAPSDGEANKQEPELASEGFFNIIDESGEGFGFDLTPETMVRPVMIGTATLFGVGMLAGVPLGIAMGRSAEESSGSTKLSSSISATASTGAKQPVRPSMDGLKFAASTFGLGTLLCASMGVAGFYAIKSYYGVNSFEEFGHVMRTTVVPARRHQMESSLAPALNSLSQAAGDNLPTPVSRAQERFGGSRFGKWIKRLVDDSVTIVPDDDDSTPADAKS